jgi:uncharacterized surface anchored protein
MKFLMALVLLSAMTSSTQVDLVVQDSSGVALKDELVIVQDLHDKEHEVLRALTDKDGRIPTLDLQPGLYRAIATAPYGLWQTEVREFLVAEKPERLALMVRPMPTQGYGDIVTVGTKRKKLKILKTDGQAASGAEIHVRDRDATLHLERWYKTNTQGETEIEIVSEPTVVVIVFGDSVTTREITDKDGELTLRLQ